MENNMEHKPETGGKGLQFRRCSIVGALMPYGPEAPSCQIRVLHFISRQHRALHCTRFGIPETLWRRLGKKMPINVDVVDLFLQTLLAETAVVVVFITMLSEQ